MPQIGSYHEPYQWKPKIQLNACAKVDDIEWPRSIDTVSVVGPSAVTAILLRKAPWHLPCSASLWNVQLVQLWQI